MKVMETYMNGLPKLVSVCEGIVETFRATSHMASQRYCHELAWHPAAPLHPHSVWLCPGLPLAGFCATERQGQQQASGINVHDIKHLTSAWSGPMCSLAIAIASNSYQ
jgi:hypothetical protein